MNIKQSVITCIAVVSITACNQPATDNKAQPADTTANTATTDPGSYLDSFKQTKNEKVFLTGLYNAYAQKLMADGLGKFDLKTQTDDGKPYKLLKLEDVKLYGGTKPYTLVYVDEIDGAMSSWPWKNLFILDDKGKILANYETEKFEPVVIFGNKDPLLVVKDETSKGHGVYHFIGIEKDTAKDFLDPKDWALLTTDGDGKIIPYTVKNVNGQPEIVFSGEFKHQPFTFTFTWNSQTNMFESKDK